MATTVHIPAPLLEAVDRRARALRVSRNRLIVLALEKDLASATPSWSEGFFEALEDADPQDAAALESSMRVVRARRSSKKAPRV